MSIFINSGGIESAINKLSRVSSRLNEAEITLKKSSSYLEFKKVSITGVDRIISKISSLKSSVIYERFSIIADKASLESAESRNSGLDFMGGSSNPFNLIAGAGRSSGGSSGGSSSVKSTKWGDALLEYLNEHAPAKTARIGNGNIKGEVPVYSLDEIASYDGMNDEDKKSFLKMDENGNWTEAQNGNDAQRVVYTDNGEIVYIESYYNVSATGELTPSIKSGSNVCSHVNPNSNALIVDFIGGEGTTPQIYNEQFYKNYIVHNENIELNSSWIIVDTVVGGQANGKGEIINSEEKGQALIDIIDQAKKDIVSNSNYSEEQLYTSVYQYSYGGYFGTDVANVLAKDNKVDHVYMVESISAPDYKYDMDRLAIGQQRIDTLNEYEVPVTCITGTKTDRKISTGSQLTGLKCSQDGKCDYLVFEAGHSNVGNKSSDYVALDHLSGAEEKLNNSIK